MTDACDDVFLLVQLCAGTCHWQGCGMGRCVKAGLISEPAAWRCAAWHLAYMHGTYMSVHPSHHAVTCVRSTARAYTARAGAEVFPMYYNAVLP